MIPKLRFAMALILAGGVLLAGWEMYRLAPAAAQPAGSAGAVPAPAEDRTPDRTAIRQVGVAFLAALESGNAKSVASQWTTEGEYHGSDGRTIRGRAAIEKAYGEGFAKKSDFKATSDVDSLRFLSKDAAVEEGHFSVRHAKAETPVVSRYSTLYVREDGAWRIAVLREWTSEGRSLKEIDWLIGTWVANRDGTEIRTTYEWALNKSFIEAKFTITKAGETSFGSQMIGLDGATGQIRMWTFDSDRGFGESTWVPDGAKKWVQDTTATLTDGSAMSATNIMTRIDDDSFTWQAIDRTLNGEPLPNIPPVKVSRVIVKK